LRKFFSLIYKFLFKLIQIITGIELPCEVEIGNNFVIDRRLTALPYTVREFDKPFLIGIAEKVRRSAFVVAINSVRGRPIIEG